LFYLEGKYREARKGEGEEEKREEGRKGKAYFCLPLRKVG